jgi:hypothetical protein
MIHAARSADLEASDTLQYLQEEGSKAADIAKVSPLVLILQGEKLLQCRCGGTADCKHQCMHHLQVVQ